MKITWVSPCGDGWGIAYRLREAGNKVVLYNPHNKNGAGYLPSVTSADWMDYAKKSDLVVYDGTALSHPTRRSWSPSQLVFELAQLRHYGVPIIGPTPATELIENDPRYLSKILKRHGLLVSTVGQVLGAVRVNVILTFTGDTTWLVLRHRNLLSGQGPEIGNLGDAFLQLRDCPLTDRFKNLHDFVGSIGHTTHMSIELLIVDDEVCVEHVFSRFIYPACFVQLSPSLIPLGVNLLNPEADAVNVAVSVLRLEDNMPAEVEGIHKIHGFVGAELHRDGSLPEVDIAHGVFVGAVCASAPTLREAQHEVYTKIGQIKSGWSYRGDVGSLLSHDMNLLKDWGYV